TGSRIPTDANSQKAAARSTNIEGTPSLIALASRQYLPNSPHWRSYHRTGGTHYYCHKSSVKRKLRWFLHFFYVVSDKLSSAPLPGKIRHPCCPACRYN